MRSLCPVYEVILRGLPSKAIVLISTRSKKGLLKKVAQLRLETHPLLFVRTGRGRHCTTQAFSVWRRYHDDG